MWRWEEPAEKNRDDGPLAILCVTYRYRAKRVSCAQLQCVSCIAFYGLCVLVQYLERGGWWYRRPSLERRRKAPLTWGKTGLMPTRTYSLSHMLVMGRTDGEIAGAHPFGPAHHYRRIHIGEPCVPAASYERSGALETPPPSGSFQWSTLEPRARFFSVRPGPRLQAVLGTMFALFPLR